MDIKKEASVGIFFFIAMIILGYFTIIMKGEIFDTREYYQMTVLFPDVEGIGVNDKIKVNGVKTGLVEKITLRENDILVECRMYTRFNLYSNYRIKIKNETALGGKYISIYPGCAESNGRKYSLIESRIELNGIPGGDIMDSLAMLVEENRENLRNTIKNIEEITGKINQGKGTLGKLINDDRVHANTDNLIKEVRDAMEDSREQAPITSFIRAALLAF